MKTTLTFFLALCFTSLFAQETIGNEPHNSASTELVVGINSTSVTSRSASIIRAYGDNGFQIGVMRKYVTGTRSTFAFGMNIMTVKHQLTFKGQTIAFDDEGVRMYNNLYFRVPVEWTYSLKANSPYFISTGLNLSSVIQNRSSEMFQRTTYIEDSGARVENPYLRNISGYREVASLDFGVRVGAGAKFKFSQMDFTAGVFYNQGLLKKDMEFRQRQVEFQLGMTIPSFKKPQVTNSQAPAYWLN